MWAALRHQTLSSSFSSALQQWRLGFSVLNRALYSSLADSSNSGTDRKQGLLQLDEVEKILSDVKADNVKVIPVQKHCEFTDYMVIATGRSAWHVRNIAQALIYKAAVGVLASWVKQKQQGARRMLLPSVEGQEGGNWIVIDSGTLIIHALDEKVRAYYNLENLWNTETSNNEGSQDLENAFVKVRRKNNSKKPAKKSA
ncbi:hypothetical protein RJ639_008956 [Escallonia herrerae]|uniref:Ribosomal silencing factor RsfS n=1 Tax=Escallonia herrerae TaxID=1293975 RepID=A0AA88VRU9_9ASTE|nr:hypothetical protein RJ639_008956 [Escallonia herrerae]